MNVSGCLKILGNGAVTEIYREIVENEDSTYKFHRPSA
jgi:hypothetical protein